MAVNDGAWTSSKYDPYTRILRRPDVLGLEAIAEHNGWAMSSIGALIVFTGLAVLSFAVSQIHRLLQLWDNRARYFRPIRPVQPEDLTDATQQETVLSREDGIAARQIKLLVERIEDPFSLPRLFELCQEVGLARSHGRINKLVEAGLIVPDEEGGFSWSQPAFEAKISNS